MSATYSLPCGAFDAPATLSILEPHSTRPESSNQSENGRYETHRTEAARSELILSGCGHSFRCKRYFLRRSLGRTVRSPTVTQCLHWCECRLATSLSRLRYLGVWRPARFQLAGGWWVKMQPVLETQRVPRPFVRPEASSQPENHCAARTSGKSIAIVHDWCPSL
jgi:hypothetical protein